MNPGAQICEKRTKTGSPRAPPASRPKGPGWGAPVSPPIPIWNTHRAQPPSRRVRPALPRRFCRPYAALSTRIRGGLQSAIPNPPGRRARLDSTSADKYAIVVALETKLHRTIRVRESSANLERTRHCKSELPHESPLAGRPRRGAGAMTSSQETCLLSQRTMLLRGSAHAPANAACGGVRRCVHPWAA